MLIIFPLGDNDKNTSDLFSQREKNTSEELDNEDLQISNPLSENKWNSSFKGKCRKLQMYKKFHAISVIKTL